MREKLHAERVELRRLRRQRKQRQTCSAFKRDDWERHRAALVMSRRVRAERRVAAQFPLPEEARVPGR